MIDTLSQARTLLRDPSHWTRNYMARNNMRRNVAYNSPDAVCWCLSGAVSLFSRSDVGDWLDTMGYLERFLPEGFHLVSQFNDNPFTKHQDIINLLDQAITALSPTQEQEPSV